MPQKDTLKISIITPSYNQAKYLEDTIYSIVDQNYPNTEYIVIDGLSTDGSQDIIRKHEKDIAYWISESDTGQSEAINKGLRRATGDIVAWLNSDDMYLPHTLKTVLKAFSDNPDVDLVYGNVENLYTNGTTKLYINKEFELINFLSHVSIHQPSVFWRRKIHDEIGYLDESLNYLMDYDLWMRIFLKYKTLKINAPLSRFRIHDNAKTANNPPHLYLEYRKVFSRFINSININRYKEKISKLGIYDNLNDTKYKIDYPIPPEPVRIICKNYILSCAIQEYTFGSVQKANKLFYHSVTFNNFIKIIYYLVKNNLGIRHITFRQ